MRTLPLALAALLVLPGCGVLTGWMTSPAAEPPVARDDGYLARDGVDDGLDLGPDQRLLLAEFSDSQAMRKKLETKVSELEATIADLRQQLGATVNERDREHGARVSAETEQERLRGQLRDRDAKLLALHLEKTRLTQDILLLKIDAAERKLQAVVEPGLDGEGTILLQGAEAPR